MKSSCSDLFETSFVQNSRRCQIYCQIGTFANRKRSLQHDFRKHWHVPYRISAWNEKIPHRIGKTMDFLFSGQLFRQVPTLFQQSFKDGQLHFIGVLPCVFHNQRDLCVQFAQSGEKIIRRNWFFRWFIAFYHKTLSSKTSTPTVLPKT